MPKLYGSKPIDEVKLRNDASSIVSTLNESLPSSSFLQELTSQSGIELATMVLHDAIMASGRYQPFIHAINNQTIAAKQLDSNIKVLVLPAYFYKQHPEVGGDGQIIVDVAKACGLQAEVLPTDSMGSVTGNAKILQHCLQKESSQHIWLVTLSKGAAELRCFLQEHNNNSEVNKIAGWINISSLANGCHLADHMLSTMARRLKTRAIATALGANFNGLHELRTDHDLWKTPCVYPARMKIVTVLPVPLLCHIERSLIPRYLRLQHLGPNDGMVLLRESLIDQGEIYPLWGSDHFFRSFQISPLLYQLFGYLLK